MTTPQTGRITYEMVDRKVGDLWVDPNVQRSLKKARVGKIAADFDADALGVLTTSYRSPKRIHVIDGQHRYRAAEAAGYTGFIHTMQYEGLTVPEEAALFRKLNTSEKVTRIDQFLVSCVEQNPDAMRLAGFITKHGWTVGPSSIEGRLAAIGSLERVYKLSPDAADATLAVLTAAFGRRPSAVQGALMEGVGRMLARYGSAVDLDNLAARLAGTPGGPDGLLGTARGQSYTNTGNLSVQVARIIVSIYNKARRTTALPAWQ